MIQPIANHIGTLTHVPTATPATNGTSRINIGGREGRVFIAEVDLDFEVILDRATQVVVVEMSIDFGC